MNSLKLSGILFAIATVLAVYAANAQQETTLILDYGWIEDGLDDTRSMGAAVHYTYAHRLGVKAMARSGSPYTYSIQPTYILSQSKHYKARASAGIAYEDRLKPMAGLTNLFKVHPQMQLSLCLESTFYKKLKMFLGVGCELKIFKK